MTVVLNAYTPYRVAVSDLEEGVGLSYCAVSSLTVGGDDGLDLGYGVIVGYTAVCKINKLSLALIELG